MSHFFRSLGKSLDIELHYTSGHHPEADGQTERVNQTLEQYLRHYCNYQQDNWAELLPLAEFAYNNAPSATTGISPFFANKGYNPNLQVHPECELASASARQYVIDLDALHQEMKTAISAAQRRYQGPADRRRQAPPELAVGSKAYVLAKFLRTTRPTRKLAEKYVGPYEVLGKAGRQSYVIRLPDSLRTVHPVFHISQLEPAVENTIPNRIQSPPPPIEVDGELEYEISEILQCKRDERLACKYRYLVRWAGYEGTSEETSWLTADDLENAQELVEEFHTRYPKPLPRAKRR